MLSGEEGDCQGAILQPPPPLALPRTTPQALCENLLWPSLQWLALS